MGAVVWADWVPCRLGAGHFGGVSQYFFYFSSYEEKNNEAGNSLNAVEREQVPQS